MLVKQRACVSALCRAALLSFLPQEQCLGVREAPSVDWEQIGVSVGRSVCRLWQQVRRNQEMIIPSLV